MIQRIPPFKAGCFYQDGEKGLNLLGATIEKIVSSWTQIESGKLLKLAEGTII
jgi:hypothetical protein